MNTVLEFLQGEIISCLMHQRRMGAAVPGKSLVGLEASCTGWRTSSHMRCALGELLILGVVVAVKVEGHFTRYLLADDVTVDGMEPPTPRLKVEYVDAGPGLPRYARIVEVKPALCAEGAMP